MDPEEIESRVWSLKLSSCIIEESFSIPEDLTSFGTSRLASCFVCKVFSSKVINHETFRVQMPCILQAKKSIQIVVIGENIYLLDFASAIYRRHALLDDPWNFFKDIVVFKEPVGLKNYPDLVFDEMTAKYWV